MRMKAFRLKRVDRDRDIAFQAWMNYQVQQKKTSGSKKNPKEEHVFKKFDDFFDYEKQIAEIEGNDHNEKLNERQKKLANLAVIANKKGG